MFSYFSVGLNIRDLSQALCCSFLKLRLLLLLLLIIVTILTIILLLIISTFPTFRRPCVPGLPRGRPAACPTLPAREPRVREATRARDRQTEDACQIRMTGRNRFGSVRFGSDKYFSRFDAVQPAFFGRVVARSSPVRFVSASGSGRFRNSTVGFGSVRPVRLGFLFLPDMTRESNPPDARCRRPHHAARRL